jgi:GH15 family glucan-1,4-alpha-glucosidase
LARASVAAIVSNQSADGAFIASPDFSQYSFCWLRDGAFTAYALDRVGEHGAAAAFHDWVEMALGGIAEMMDLAVEKRLAMKSLEPGGMPPARFGLDGSVVADDWPNFQIDGYGTWLWALREHLRRSGGVQLAPGPRSCVERTARYLSSFAFDPCFDVWEMHGTEVHTSTLGSVYAGLAAAAELLDDGALLARSEQVREHLFAGTAASGRFVKSSANDETEASTLWLGAPFGAVDPDVSEFVSTVSAVERELVVDGGVRRFPTDTYFGGGAWPVLTASLGWHYASVGDEAGARRCLEWVEDRFDASGELGEQFGGERRDPAMYAEWVERWGPPAKQLIWSHAMHLVLLAELGLVSGELR